MGINLAEALSAARVTDRREITIQVVEALAVTMPVVAVRGGLVVSQTFSSAVAVIAIGQVGVGNLGGRLTKALRVELVSHGSGPVRRGW